MGEYKYLDIVNGDLGLKNADRVLKITLGDDKVTVSEGCDEYFFVEYDKEDSILVFEEIIDAIKKDKLLQ